MVANVTDGLTPEQEGAILALLAEPTVARAAEKCGGSERTIHRWLREPVFRAAYHDARRESFRQALSLAHRLAAPAMLTLGRIMQDPAAPYSAKVSAASQVLKFGRDGLELDDLAERIESLEAARSNGEDGFRDAKRGSP